MKLAQTLTFDIVVMALTRAKRNLIVVLLFIGWLGLAVFLAILFNSKIVMPFCIVPFVFLVMWVSNKAMKLKRIGSVSMLQDEIVLVNEVLHLKRVIQINELKSILIRGGARSNLTGTLKKLTLFLDLQLKSKEEVVVHIQVPDDDILTADRITNYCKEQQVSCSWKL